MIKEISNLLLDREYTKGQGIPDVAVELLNKAKSSISTINSKTLSNQSRRIYRESKAKIYDAKLTQLTLVTLNLASYPGSWWAERKEPGIYSSRMRVIIPC